MKTTIVTAATLISVSLFSASISAKSFGQDAEEDILHGNGAVASSPSTPYLTQDNLQNGIQTDMLSNRHEFDNASKFDPYVILGGELDNRDDLRDHPS